MKTNNLASIILFSLFTTSASAFDTDQALHPVAHGAGSYALTHMGSIVCTKTTDLSKRACSFIAGAVTLGVGAAIEAAQVQDEGSWKQGMFYDAIGVGVSIAVIHFDF